MNTTSRNVISIASHLNYRPIVASPSSGASTSSQPAATVARRPRRSRAPTVEDAHDDDLVERITLGDLEAADELRSRYLGRMRRIARLVLGDDREAARAADSALEEACSGFPPERGRVDRWLVRLARRAALARQRTLWGTQLT